MITQAELEASFRPSKKRPTDRRLACLEQRAADYDRGVPGVEVSREERDKIVELHSIGLCSWMDMVCYGGPPTEKTYLTPHACQVCQDELAECEVRSYPDDEEEYG